MFFCMIDHGNDINLLPTVLKATVQAKTLTKFVLIKTILKTLEFNEKINIKPIYYNKVLTIASKRIEKNYYNGYSNSHT